MPSVLTAERELGFLAHQGCLFRMVEQHPLLEKTKSSEGCSPWLMTAIGCDSYFYCLIAVCCHKNLLLFLCITVKMRTTVPSCCIQNTLFNHSITVACIIDCIIRCLGSTSNITCACLFSGRPERLS